MSQQELFQSPHVQGEFPQAHLERIAIGLAKRLDKTVADLRLVQAMCGNPDPAEGCRLILRQVNAMIDDLTLGPGDPRRHDRPQGQGEKPCP